MESNKKTKATNLVKIILEIWFRVDPGSHSVTEVNKIIDHPLRVSSDHGANTTKCRVFLIIISNVAERHTPGPNELG